MKLDLWHGSLLAVITALSLTTMNVFVKLIGTSVPIYELIFG